MKRIVMMMMTMMKRVAIIDIQSGSADQTAEVTIGDDNEAYYGDDDDDDEEMYN